MAYQGDTVRLKCYFKTFNGTLIDPTDIKLTIYDKDKQQIEQFILDDTNKEDVGIFFYDYVLPENQELIIFEFAGSYNNKPILVRNSVNIQFSK